MNFELGLIIGLIAGTLIQYYYEYLIQKTEYYKQQKQKKRLKK